MREYEERGYKFERPNQKIETPVIMKVAKSVADMRSNALFLSLHAENEESKHENQIIERTLRSVMSIIKEVTSGTINK